jgi:hypothetical protein
MDRRLNDRAIATPFFAGGHTVLFRQMHQMIIQAMECGGLNQLLTLLNGAVTWDSLIINPTEPPPLGIAHNLVVRRGITPSHQATRYADAECHLDRRGRSSIPRRLGR